MVVNLVPHIPQVRLNPVQTIPGARPAVRFKLALQTDLRFDKPEQAREKRRGDHDEWNEIGRGHGISGAAGGMKLSPSNVNPTPG